MALLTFIPYSVSFANIDIEELEPNVYEKGKVNPNTDYLHEKSLYELKQPIPEEQKGLTFEKEDNPNEKIKKKLFQDQTNENNTIAAKAEQWKLFGDEKMKSYQTRKYDSLVETKENTHLVMLYIVCIMIGIVLIFLLLIFKGKQRTSS